MKDGKEENKLSERTKKVLKVIMGLVVALLFVVTYRAIRNPDVDETDTKNEELIQSEGEGKVEDDIEEELVADDEPEYVDERPELEDSGLDDLEREVFHLASTAKWSELIVLLDRYDKEYNLETTEQGAHLKDIYWDATVIERLAQMGDDENAIIAGTEKIPHLSTLEMYVWALYFLPRNNIVDLSVDSLALAPSARGEVLITSIERTGETDEDSLEGTLHEDEHIKYFKNVEDYDSIVDGFAKVEITNHGVPEVVYIATKLDDTFELIGIYSEDEYYSNKVETVSHFRKFSEDVGAALQQMIDEAEKERDEMLKENIKKEQEKNN